MNNQDQAKEDNEKLIKISKFLNESGKITEVIDINKKHNIIVSNSELLISFFLLIACIGIVLYAIYGAFMDLVVHYNRYTNVQGILTFLFGNIFIGFLLIILSSYYKNKGQLKIVYTNKKQMIINKSTYNLETDSCYISIICENDIESSNVTTINFLNDTTTKNNIDYNNISNSNSLNSVLKIISLNTTKVFKLYNQKDQGFLTPQSKIDIEGLLEFINNFKYENDIPKLKINSF